MRGMQEVLMEKIETALVIYDRHPKIEVRKAPRYANCGTLYAQVGPRTLLKLSYDFQDTRFRIDAWGVGHSDLPEWFKTPEDAVFESAGLSWYAIQYDEDERITRMLACLTHLVLGRLAGVKP